MVKSTSRFRKKSGSVWPVKGKLRHVARKGVQPPADTVA